MIGKLVFLLLCFLISTHSYDEIDLLIPELELTELELQDDCENLANAYKNAISKQNYSEAIEAENNFAATFRPQAEHLKSFQDVPSDVLRNWTFLTRPGDVLLPEEDWRKLVTFKLQTRELKTSLKLQFTQQEYENILQNNHDLDLLNQTWSLMQDIYVGKEKQYEDVLKLVQKSAELHESDPKTYWEYLNDNELAYATVDTLWTEFEPLYKKLHTFVQKRLFNYYNITDESDLIPVYLLGSNFGDDWSHIADIILPHPQLHYDRQTFLKQNPMETVYAFGETFTSRLGFPGLGKKFWSNTDFNRTTCSSELLTFCNQQYTEVETCNTASWTQYLDAYENCLKISLNNHDYSSWMRQNLRYSALDEAITQLGSILAIMDLPANKESEEMTKLLLVALRVLPKLPYYLAAERWRLELLEKGGDLVESWWNKRKQLQGVEGVTNHENDFLGDNQIISNKPYLSKFLAPFISFQIIEYYSALGTPLIEQFTKDETFMAMINDRLTNDWPYLMTLHFGISEITATSLLKYFKPLEKYLETAPMEQQEIVTTTKHTTTSTTPATRKTTIFNEKTTKTVAKQSENLQRDQPKANGTLTSADEGNAAQQAGIYVGVALIAIIATVILATYLRKKFKKRRLPVNRRFET